MKIVFILYISFMASLSAYAQFAGGSGTEKSPYLVSDAYQLSDVRNYPNCYFKQINDIDLSEWIDDNSPRLGWAPIGTSVSPFNGTYDGDSYSIKGLRIYRPTSDCVGLFGCVSSENASLKNICLYGAYIEGETNVGFISGANSGNTIICGCVVNGGRISGQTNVGGIVGTTTAEVHDCYVFADIINALGDCGGIVGSTVHSTYNNYVYANISSSGNAGGIVGKSFQNRVNWDGSDVSVNGELHDSRFDGTVTSSTYAGGIIGWDNYNHHYTSISSYKPVTYYHNVNDGLNVNRCFTGKGNVKSSVSASGIVGFRVVDEYYLPNPGSQTSNSVCALSYIESPLCYRIQNVADGHDNIASLNTTFIINGTPDNDIEDNDYNGISYGDKTLYRASTYTGLGWDMTNTWTIEEGNNYPYLKRMSKAPTVEDYVTGSKCSIKGTGSNNGIINIIKNGEVYSAVIVDGRFEINIGAVNVGDTIYYNAVESNKQPSIVQQIVIENKIPELETILGDSNSDGAVDAADVVGTINYILGKPSSSFNQQNADVNEDGQILVDDAVGTVNVIMNNQ